MIWTKEVPTKPGKYIIRYMDETTGRMRYGTYTVNPNGVGGICFKRLVESSVLESWKFEFSKRVENVD